VRSIKLSHIISYYLIINNLFYIFTTYPLLYESY